MDLWKTIDTMKHTCRVVIAVTQCATATRHQAPSSRFELTRGHLAGIREDPTLWATIFCRISWQPHRQANYKKS
ncbi:hypothetical protein EGT86_30155 [Burkholderia pseudomallei]|nr:hypothetical protein EGT86_30155 [Burkholderia pseudomallei]